MSADQFDVRDLARQLLRQDCPGLSFDELERWGLEAVLPYYLRANMILTHPPTERRQ